ncbi:hypothetical protein HHK36_001695 [Tetracentron sinense]|uniref:Uncharacterized protein n=1 Tax=Tetracentron sinense TaxID=13715 RepID=A0A835DS95_TETSI|nr:hypothetical protein HHK36_001695 [Tetracentron sinense]
MVLEESSATAEVAYRNYLRMPTTPSSKQTKKMKFLSTVSLHNFIGRGLVETVLKLSLSEGVGEVAQVDMEVILIVQKSSANLLPILAIVDSAGVIIQSADLTTCYDERDVPKNSYAEVRKVASLFQGRRAKKSSQVASRLRSLQRPTIDVLKCQSSSEAGRPSPLQRQVHHGGNSGKFGEVTDVLLGSDLSVADDAFIGVEAELKTSRIEFLSFLRSCFEGFVVVRVSKFEKFLLANIPWLVVFKIAYLEEWKFA